MKTERKREILNQMVSSLNIIYFDHTSLLEQKFSNINCNYWVDVFPIQTYTKIIDTEQSCINQFTGNSNATNILCFYLIKFPLKEILREDNILLGKKAYLFPSLSLLNEKYGKKNLPINTCN